MKEETQGGKPRHKPVFILGIFVQFHKRELCGTEETNSVSGALPQPQVRSCFVDINKGIGFYSSAFLLVVVSCSERDVSFTSLTQTKIIPTIAERYLRQR